MLRKRFLLLFSAAMVGLGLLWVEDYTRQSTLDINDSAQLQPDYYGQGLSSLSFSSQGSLKRQLKAQRSTHYPKQQIAEFSLLNFSLLQDSGERWQIEAKVGVHYQQTDRLLLQQDVRVSSHSRDPTVGNQVSLFTQELILLNQQQQAKTDKAVRIEYPLGQLEAKGMKIDFNTQRIDFLSQVKARYAPQ